MIKKSLLGKSKIALLLFYLIPFVIIFLFVSHFSVNVPYFDQWELVSLFEKVNASKANFIDFFAQHNEHRLFFPKFIFVILAFSSKWNIEYELYFNIFLATIIFLVLYKTSTLQKENSRNISWHLTNVLTCILIFSLVQYENWFWGFQIAWFLIVTCLVTSVLIVTLAATHSRMFYLAAIPCFIASFSSAQGLLTWLAVIPSVACINGSFRLKIIRTVMWLLFFFATCIVYFIGYQKPDQHPSTLFFLQKPLVAVEYFFTLLGTPLTNQVITAFIVGILLLLIFLYLTAHFIQKSKPKFQVDSEVTAWISIGLFAILFALMTTVGRAGFGVEQALSSRYTTSSILLLIATAQLWRLCFWNNSFLAGIIIGIILIRSVDIIPQVTGLQLQKQAGATCLELVNFIDESPGSCLEYISPSANTVRGQARILEQIGFRKFPTNLTFIEAPDKNHGFIDSPSTNETFLTISKNSMLNMTGWAILPERPELPKLVLFSYGDQKSFFANTVVNLDSPDVAKALNSSRYNKVRWSANISPKYLPLGATTIKGWVYNPASQQFIRLHGEPKLTVVE